MDLKIVAIGRLRAGPETQLCSRYEERIRKSGRAHGLNNLMIAEIAESRAPKPAERKTAEAAAIAGAVPGGFSTICLHEGGDLIDSPGLAQVMRNGAEQGLPGQVFIIGGPDGLDRALLDRCDRQISFGRLTWPHQLVRVMLLEQVYRAMTILSGHPYHRA